jgi:hypothetical protein
MSQSETGHNTVCRFVLLNGGTLDFGPLKGVYAADSVIVESI